MTVLPSLVRMKPGAVPTGLGTTSAPRGRRACFSSLSTSVIPRCRAKVRMTSAEASSGTRSRPQVSANTAAVISSSVGPRASCREHHLPTRAGHSAKPLPIVPHCLQPSSCGRHQHPGGITSRPGRLRWYLRFPLRVVLFQLKTTRPAFAPPACKIQPSSGGAHVTPQLYRIACSPRKVFAGMVKHLFWVAEKSDVFGQIGGFLGGWISLGRLGATWTVLVLLGGYITRTFPDSRRTKSDSGEGVGATK